MAKEPCLRFFIIRGDVIVFQQRMQAFNDRRKGRILQRTILCRHHTVTLGGEEADDISAAFVNSLLTKTRKKAIIEALILKEREMKKVTLKDLLPISFSPENVQ